MHERSREILDLWVKQYSCAASVGALTPTVCDLFGIAEPSGCGAEPLAAVTDQANHFFGGAGRLERAVLFCADALGEVQRLHYADDFAAIEDCAGLRILSASVMPSVTPVCYGSIFTGAAPEVHGITKYEKPVIQIETLFDALVNSGKNAAIACCCGCSIDKIFRDREIDYYSFQSKRGTTEADELAFEQTLELIRRDRHDLIVCYMTNYDHEMHLHGPFSPEAAAQAHLAALRFRKLRDAIDRYWRRYNRLLAFVPDHGGHTIERIHGTHGTDLPDDMVVNHYYHLGTGSR